MRRVQRRTTASRRRLSLRGHRLQRTVPRSERPAPEARSDDRAGQALELATPYEPPAGRSARAPDVGLREGALLPALFITGLGLDDAIENVGLFTGPLAARRKVARPVVDRQRRQVRVAMRDGTTLTARYLGSQGCVTLPPGRDDVAFTPVEVTSALPEAALIDWPMGDRLPARPLPPEIDPVKLQRALDEAFQPDEALTTAVVITYRGRLIAERYHAEIRRPRRSRAGRWGRA